jgi:hypothetical protein
MFRVTHTASLTAVILCAGAADAGIGDQLHKLLADDGAADDWFGSAVAMSGNWIVVGAHRDDDAGSESGAVYLFDTTTGTQIAKLVPSDPDQGDRFGYSVAIDGNTIVVGSTRDDENGINSGSAYIFDATTGAQTNKLLATDGGSNDEFGYAVAVSGTTAAIGSWLDDDNGANSGSVYLFDTTTGTQLDKLVPDDGVPGANFGNAVSISGTTVVVGSYRDDNNGSQSGSAYLFDATTGEQEAKLLPGDGGPDEHFGWSVGIDGTTAIIGAINDDGNGPNAGAAYLFETGSGSSIGTLRAYDGGAFENFGFSVGICDGTIIVGAPFTNDHGPSSGAMYLFDVFSQALIAKVIPDDGAASDYFGYCVTIDGCTALVGAYMDDDSGGASGSAYVFDATRACSPADITTQGAGVGDPRYGFPDGLITGADIQYYVNFWLLSDLGVADLTTTGAGVDDPGFGVPDGQITGADIQFYVNLWVAGCP